MKLFALAIVLFPASGLTAALAGDAWGTTLDEYADSVLWKRNLLQHVDSQAELGIAGPAEAIDDLSDDAAFSGAMLRRGDSCGYCPANARSCCPDWDRCFRKPPEKIKCCKVSRYGQSTSRVIPGSCEY